MASSQCPAMAVPGDFNIHVDSNGAMSKEFKSVLNCFGLSLHVDFPTHSLHVDFPTHSHEDTQWS